MTALKPAIAHSRGKQTVIKHPGLPPHQICVALSEASTSVHCTFFLWGFVIPALTHRAWHKWRLISAGALAPDKKENEIFNSSKKCDIKLPVSSYQTCLNIFGSPPSKHRTLQSQFSSPGWRCWQYPAGWLLLAGKRQDTKIRIKKACGTNRFSQVHN